MKYSLIDIGSNSIRLAVYETVGASFKILFKEKIIAGLAGYVENGCLTDKGIECAIDGLIEFKNILKHLGILDNCSVFATASLRNIVNTDEAKAKISSETGFNIEIISGEEEAILGYTGAMKELELTKGIFTDIGGASTEIIVFSNSTPLFSNSYPIGSLKLYRDCVKKILPGKGSYQRIKEVLNKHLKDEYFCDFKEENELICVGGTARSVLKTAKAICDLPNNINFIYTEQLSEIHRLFFGDPKRAADVILKTSPERIHTIIPGFMILEHIVDKFGIKKIIVSNYGVREGYLCQKLLHQPLNNTNTLKTES